MLSPDIAHVPQAKPFLAAAAQFAAAQAQMADAMVRLGAALLPLIETVMPKLIAAVTGLVSPAERSEFPPTSACSCATTAIRDCA